MDELLLAYLIEDDDEVKDDGKVIKSQFLESLTVEERRLRYNRIPRCALMTTENSSFVRLFESGNDQALIAATGLNHVTFEYVKLYSRLCIWHTLPTHQMGSSVNALQLKVERYF